MECHQSEVAEVSWFLRRVGVCALLLCQSSRDEFRLRSRRSSSARRVILTFVSFSNLSQTSQKYLANTSSSIGFPLILILSLTATMCGEVYKPVRAFGARVRRRESVKAEVEPLPLVPVMWRTLRGLRSSGCSDAARSARGGEQGEGRANGPDTLFAVDIPLIPS